MDEQYFIRRLAYELQLAEAAPDAAERSVHLRACRYLCALIGVSSDHPAIDAQAPLNIPAERSS